MLKRGIVSLLVIVITVALLSTPAYSRQKVLLAVFNGIKNNVYNITSDYLKRKLFKVVVTSTTAEVETDTADTIFANKLLKDVKGEDYKALIILNAPQELSDTSDIVRLAAHMNAASKIIAAIYDAPLVLAEAGILSGKRATVWATEYKKLIEAGAMYKGTPVVVDGNIITAGSYQALPAFLTKLMDMLTREEEKK